MALELFDKLWESDVLAPTGLRALGEEANTILQAWANPGLLDTFERGQSPEFNLSNLRS